jgi:hypothetical protein
MRLQGLTRIEQIVLAATVMTLLFTGIPNVRTIVNHKYDSGAESDYRDLKLAVFDAITGGAAPDTFSLVRVRGPRSLPAPLDAASIHEGTEVTVFHQTRYSKDRQPTTATRIAVQNVHGGKIFQLTEVNGILSEQVIERR